MQLITIGSNQAGQRFDKFLHKYLPQASSGFIYKMLRKKNITLNGKKAEGKEILTLGDEVKLFLAQETLEKFTGLPAASANYESTGEEDELVKECGKAYRTLKGITVLYEDAHVLILNKPAGILTQKAQQRDDSLNEWMIGYLLDTGGITPQELRLFHPSVCNRLDRNTSGIVLCGKSLAGSQELSQLIRERTVRKYYRTIVAGTLQEADRIEGWLIKDRNTNKVTVISEHQGGRSQASESESGELQQGSYIRTAYCPLQCRNRLTYLEVELITGKTHQIRAHLSSIGHPVIGDGKYGNNRLNQELARKYSLKWQLLHAYRLEFPVMTGVLAGLSERKLTAPLPPLFNRILQGEITEGL